jgi:hypothetical protein
MTAHYQSPYRRSYLYLDGKKHTFSNQNSIPVSEVRISCPRTNTAVTHATSRLTTNSIFPVQSHPITLSNPSTVANRKTQDLTRHHSLESAHQSAADFGMISGGTPHAKHAALSTVNFRVAAGACAADGRASPCQLASFPTHSSYKSKSYLNRHPYTKSTTALLQSIIPLSKNQRLAIERPHRTISSPKSGHQAHRRLKNGAPNGAEFESGQHRDSSLTRSFSQMCNKFFSFSQK